MTQYRTTLGSPISPEEYDRIQEALVTVKDFAESIPLEMRPEYYLGMAVGLIDHGFKLRDTVNKVFIDANRRHGKAAVGGPRKRTPLDSLDITPESIEEVLKALIGVKK